MWTKDQLAKFRRGLAVAQKHKDRLDRLAKLAESSPQFADAVAQLRTRRDHLETLSAAALEMEQSDG